MFPLGISYCNRTWDDVITEIVSIKSLSPKSPCSAAPASNKSGLLHWWKELLSNSKSGRVSPIEIQATVSDQLRDSFSIDTAMRLIPTDWAIFYHMNTNKSKGINELVHLERLTLICSKALSNQLHSSEGFSPRHLLLRWSRRAYRLAINSVKDNHREGNSDNFKGAFRFLAVLNAPDAEIWNACELYLMEPLFTALIGLSISCQKLSESCNQSASPLIAHSSEPNDSTPLSLSTMVLVELQNLLDLTNVLTSASSTNTEGLQRLVCLLFDRLATLVIYQSGLRPNNACDLWIMLFEDVDHSNSVIDWSAFWLTDNAT